MNSPGGCTTGWYRGDDIIVPLEEAPVAATGFDITLPNGRIYGTLDEMCVEASLSDGSGSLDMHSTAASPIIFNGGTGIFPMLGMQIHQYSVPRLNSRGMITIEDKVYSVAGLSWFDRQWQQVDLGDAGEEAIKWSWMDINLDCGDAISLWSLPASIGGEQRAEATVLHSVDHRVLQRWSLATALRAIGIARKRCALPHALDGPDTRDGCRLESRNRFRVSSISQVRGCKRDDRDRAWQACQGLRTGRHLEMIEKGNHSRAVFEDGASRREASPR